MSLVVRMIEVRLTMKSSRRFTTSGKGLGNLRPLFLCAKSFLLEEVLTIRGVTCDY